MHTSTKDLLVGLALVAMALALGAIVLLFVACDEGGDFDWRDDGDTETQTEEHIPWEYDCEEGDCRDWTDPDPECHVDYYGETLRIHDVQCRHSTGKCDYISTSLWGCDCVWVTDGPDYCAD